MERFTESRVLLALAAIRAVSLVILTRALMTNQVMTHLTMTPVTMIRTRR